MSDYNLEYALNEMENVQAMLDVIRWDLLAEMSDDHQLHARERDAITGAITSMGWAVARVTAAWEAEWNAKRAGAQDEQAA